MLQGKVIAVTGGASGLGRAISIAAAEAGARAVFVADLTRTPKEGGEPTDAIITGMGITAQFVKTDVGDEDDLKALITATEALGGLDAMVCNAGIAVPNDGMEIPEADFRRLMRVNMDGVFLSARLAARQMRTRGKAGSIVLMASMGGLRGAAPTLAYTMSKGAVRLLARSLADELGPDGIRVNAVCPGLIETELMHSSPGVSAMAETLRLRTPLRRLGQPSEIGDVVVWLCSDKSSYVTAADIVVDGGITAII